MRPTFVVDIGDALTMFMSRARHSATKIWAEPRVRQVATLVLQATLAGCSAIGAIWLRFDGNIPPAYIDFVATAVPLLVIVRLVVFVPFRLFDGIWRYTSLWDARNIVAAVGISSAIFFFVARDVIPGAAYSTSILVIDSLLLVCLIAGVLLTHRMCGELRQTPRARTVLVFGAGDAGEMIVRDMRTRPEYDLRPIGFLDDDQSKVGRSIHGVKVLGTGAEAERIIATCAPNELLIAVPSATPEAMRRIVRNLERSKVRITTFPNLLHVIGRPVDLKQIRELRVEDLLARAPVGLEWEPVRRGVANARVLVTGAGGSIGSEICRQVAAFRPTCLVALDRYENSLVELVNGLEDSYSDVVVHGVVADITDEQRMEDVFSKHNPTMVFHAAAHKHVPLMEANACEAIKNNVRGSRVVAEAALRHGASQFVLISTDKAVNPVSVMGASKRVAEMIVRDLAASRGGTNLITVRFGNVLGSNGSVIPRFVDQIRRGGPVTVTHPEISRYFMLVQEAVQLVLCAVTLREPGGSYVLDMGEPVKLIDLARDLIRLAGYIPEEEIRISITGLRPGEKLHEELVGPGEVTEQSPIPKVLRVRETVAGSPGARLQMAATALEQAAYAGDSDRVVFLLREIIPNFNPGCREFTEAFALSRPIRKHHATEN
jgi:FlaA1/EpsC-like NDP-sugar epimerase